LRRAGDEETAKIQKKAEQSLKYVLTGKFDVRDSMSHVRAVRREK